MQILRKLVPLALVGALAACGASANGDGGGSGDGPPPGAPAANQALAVAQDLELGHPDSAAVLRRDWEIEVEFDTNDHRAVVDHYDGWLTGADFVRTEVEDDGDEYEATYRNDALSLRAELEIDDEDDDDGVEVDLDMTDATPYAAGATPPVLSGTSFGTSDAPLDFSFFDRALIDEIEWDFRVVYERGSGIDESAVFAHFDGALVDLGWHRTDVDDDDEAEYELDGIELDLEVDDEDEGIEVEIELDKDRFY